MYFFNLFAIKKDKKHRTSSVINQNLEPLHIPTDSHLFLYLSRIQEEVHRFAITYHRSLKQKGALTSYLDVIPGIGPVRRKALLKQFGSLKKMREATVEELTAIVGKEAAANLFEVLHTDI